MKLRSHPKGWCIRLTVYEPQESFHGSNHSSIGVEGPCEERLARFLQAFTFGVHRLDQDDVAALERMTAKMTGDLPKPGETLPRTRCAQCGAGPDEEHRSELCR